jgi:hypothetical protein
MKVQKGKMIGGVALVAYPAQYGSSGIMTFIVNHAGEVPERFGREYREDCSEDEAFQPGKHVEKSGRKGSQGKIGEGKQNHLKGLARLPNIHHMER